MLPKYRVFTGTGDPGGPSSAALMVSELESLTPSPVSLHHHKVVWSAAVQTCPVQLFSTLSRQEEQRFCHLNTQIPFHIRKAGKLV